MEQKYAGLRIEDKAALLDAKAKGAVWIARDWDGNLYGEARKPTKRTWIWSYHVDSTILLNSELPFIQWSDPEPVDIDAALAQIAEMEAAQTEKPPTWNDALNAMSAEEKAQWLLIDFPKLYKKAYDYAWKNRKTGEFSRYYRERITELLSSPYDGGKAQGEE